MFELEKPLDETEQIELLNNKDNPKVKEKLIMHNLKLVLWVAKKYQREGNLNRDLDDLFQEGVIGLINAIEDYDEEKGAFVTFAVMHIRGSILRAITNKGKTIRLPSYMIELINKMQKISSELEVKLGRGPTPKEISKVMDLSIDKVNELLNIKDDPVSLHTIIGGDSEDITLMDSIADDGPTPDEIAESNVFIEQFKEELKDRLNELQYESIRLYYGLDCPEHTLKEIGAKYNKNFEQVRRARDEGLNRIRRSRFIADIRNELDNRTSFVRSIDYSQPKVKGGQYVSPVERIVLERERIARRIRI